MSKDIYEASMELLEDSLGLPEYKDIILDLEKKFLETHITISDIDSTRDNLYNYYYEKTLSTNIENGSQNILDLIFQNGNLDKDSYNFLSNSSLSIYMVKKIKRKEFIVYDIFSKNIKIALPLTDEWIAIEKGDLIQTFLYYGDIVPYFSTSGFIHPKEVQKFILKEVKEIKKNKLDYSYIDIFLAKLFRKFVYSMRYFKKNPLEIYKIDL